MGLFVGYDVGVKIRKGESYYVPDAHVVHRTAIVRGRQAFDPPDMLLVVEVLSEGNRRNDLVLKRGDYGSEGIPAYWIVDPDEQTLTVLELGSGDRYRQRAVLRPGEIWRGDRPFPLTLDPAEFFWA